MKRNPSVPDRLEECAAVFRERQAIYGDNYKQFGAVMNGLFPEGLPIGGRDDWNRLGILVQVVSKLTRYVANWNDGGHEDSLTDLSVYAQMLNDLDHEVKVLKDLDKLLGLTDEEEDVA